MAEEIYTPSVILRYELYTNISNKIYMTEIWAIVGAQTSINIILGLEISTFSK